MAELLRPMTFSAHKLTENMFVTVKVKLNGLNKFKFRVWLSMQILKLYSWISPLKTEIKYKKGK